MFNSVVYGFFGFIIGTTIGAFGGPTSAVAMGILGLCIGWIYGRQSGV